MSSEKLDSYCGIYCGACDMLMAGKTGHKSKFALFQARKNIGRYLKTHGIGNLEENDCRVACKGCKSDELFISCRPCKIRKCAREKGVGHCSDCGDFPCKRYNLFKMGRKLLAHLETAPRNLETIRRAGTTAWLEEQKRAWTCPQCGNGFSWYSNTCATCGNNLTKRTYKFTRIRSTLVKLTMMLNVDRIFDNEVHGKK